ncbi:MAG: UPF0179 family protein [Candidatus Thermoplasmatota archaeon]|jgi:uncharacterized protein (UPF0179 family)|nr:UPF0179 family protein [Candidatus Thermoplasmatota archaeon]MCL5799909.1 UPF0179 family protein [Candidatus Thermoplasmatota archaeon]
MPKVSFIGTSIAREGLEFVFAGSLQECSGCKVKNVCFSLEPGRKYRVAKVREKTNPCGVFLGDRAVAVEVEEVEEHLNTRYDLSVQEGSTITTTSMKCGQLACPNLETCNLLFMREGIKAKIEKVEGKLECPAGFDMRRLKVSYR